MKIGVLIDNGSLTKWQADALLSIADCGDFIVYNCTNNRSRRNVRRHGLYYALNLFSLRTALTARLPLPPGLSVAGQLDFKSDHDGAWQALPKALLVRIARDRPSIILKFGMGLLRVPTVRDLPCPILSYHHGDPRHYRGRPAGFYELLSGRAMVGQVIQILTNRLDGGEVVAFAETKAHPHSYRRTMAEAYRCSPLILPAAIANVLAGTPLAIAATGKSYRLPSNATVLRFVIQRLASLIRRLAYGVFVEKAWEVAQAPLPPSGDDRVLPDFPEFSAWKVVNRPRGYRFLADPFFHPQGEGLLVEALRVSTGRGEILQVAPAGAHSLLADKGHYSYPATFTNGDEHYLLPEVSEWSPPQLFRFRGSQLEALGELKLAGRPRLIDPTVFASNGTLFLFANRASEGSSVLRLWCSESILGDFAEHPASPVRISPAGSRMGGTILNRNGHLFRVGQDFCGQYGDGILLFRIEQLSRTDYLESEAGELRFAGCRGPHTLNLGSGTILFDYYRERFSLLAGARRLRAALVK